MNDFQRRVIGLPTVHIYLQSSWCGQWTEPSWLLYNHLTRWSLLSIFLKRGIGQWHKSAEHKYAITRFHHWFWDVCVAHKHLLGKRCLPQNGFCYDSRGVHCGGRVDDSGRSLAPSSPAPGLLLLLLLQMRQGAMSVLCQVGNVFSYASSSTPSRFPCCVLSYLSWNTAGGGDCI